MSRPRSTTTSAKTVLRSTLALLLLIAAGVAQAQYPYPQPGPPPGWGQPQAPQLPPPVDLPIQNIPQQTQVWCWAAVAQQIIMATRGPQATPPQCALVARAFGQHPNSCCGNPANCTVTGQLPQIQALIAEFGGRHSSVQRPTDPMTLYQTLAAGKAIIMAVKSSPFAGHVVVLRGMAWMPTPYGTVEPMLIINDPMAYYTQPVPFSQVAQIWEQAIVIQ
ncbi:MAG: papain-like cysteine protease family protein [Pseudomonadota bacterium]